MSLTSLLALGASHPALASAMASAAAGMLTLAALLVFGRAATRVTGRVGVFAAASLLAATLLHLLPEAMSLSVNAGLFALTGFATVYAMSTLTSGPRASPAAAVAPMLGIGVHSFLDGALHATVFAIDFRAGLVSSPGLVLHEVAETTLLFMLLLRAGLGRWSAGGLSLLGAVATTPLGALVSEGPIVGLPGHQLGWALGAVSGSLIYLSVSHLSEALSDGRRWFHVAGFGAAVAVTAFLLNGPPPARHGHEHGHERDHDHHGGHESPDH